MGADASKPMTLDEEEGPAGEASFMDKMRDSVAGGVNAVAGKSVIQTSEEKKAAEASMCGLDQKTIWTLMAIVAGIGIFFLLLSFIMMYIFIQLIWYDSMWLAVVVMTIGNLFLLGSTFFLNAKAQLKVFFMCGTERACNPDEMKATCSPWRQIALGLFVGLMILTIVFGIGTQFMDPRAQAVMPLFIGFMALIQIIAFAVYIVLIVKPLRKMIGGLCIAARAMS
jgi:hypothetical protein